MNQEAMDNGLPENRRSSLRPRISTSELPNDNEKAPISECNETNREKSGTISIVKPIDATSESQNDISERISVQIDSSNVSAPKKRGPKPRSSMKPNDATSELPKDTTLEKSSIQTESSNVAVPKKRGPKPRSSVKPEASLELPKEFEKSSIQTEPVAAPKKRGPKPKLSMTPDASLELPKELEKNCIQTEPVAAPKKRGPKPKLSMIPSDDTEISMKKKSRKRKRDGDVYEDDYEIEAIVDHVRAPNGRISEYLVKWKGWDSTYNTWEPLSHLRNCQEAIANYFYDTVYKEVRGDLSLISSSLAKSLKKFTQQEIDDVCYLHFTENGDTIPEIDVERVNSDIEILVKIPVFARDEYLLQQVKNDLLFLEIKARRIAQLELLKAWEEELNRTNDSPKPIKVINAVDLDTRPIDFNFINKRIAGFGVKILEDPQFTISCDCTDCLIKCACKRAWGLSSYKNNGSVKVGKGTPIYECNSKCKCSTECSNRVVQRGRQVSVAIFKTDNGRGWGLKTLEKIQKGQFVTEYVGEVIMSSDADGRLKKYNQNGIGNYMFALDFNSRDEYPYTVDGTWLGNESHFINHSCKPNLSVFGVYINCMDPDLPQLALFANRTIQPDEELTYDYFQDASTTQSHVSRSVDSSFFDVCKCGAPNCRKVVPS